ncbi:hypothetical protein PQ459_10470 [Chryseobacterium sp. KACC 21268]|nr:hypothetical protein PQ459_10470 [Chryseobacterium sp. KACC 21268]
MSISYYDFKNLSGDLQYEVVMAEGKVIDENFRDQLKFVLYEVSTFFVEIVYNTVTDRIESLGAFQNIGT